MKKLVIKPYRQNMGMDLARAQGIWASLRSAINEIFSHNASLLSFEELYRWVPLLTAAAGWKGGD